MNFWQNLPKPFFVLAPMEDVTDFVFREVMSNNTKPDVLFTEFASADGLMSDGKDRVIRKFLYSKKQRPIVAQIWSDNPNHLYNSTKLVNELGFDGVDINMGCPDKGVIKKGAGSALIKNFALAKQIIEEVKRGAGGTAVSVKTRLGFDKVITNEWISFLLEQKIDAISIHGRIATKMSKLPADWDEIKKSVTFRDKICPDTLIIGNGDVKSYAQGLQYAKDYNVDGIMIGRGIFANPWFFENPQQTHNKDDYIQMLLEHTKLFVKTWDQKNFNIMKKFFKMYIRDFDGADLLRQKLMQCTSYEEVEKILIK